MQYQWIDVSKDSSPSTYLFQSRIYTIKLTLVNKRTSSFIAKYYNSNGNIRIFPDQNLYGVRDIIQAQKQALLRVEEILTTELDNIKSNIHT